MSNFFHEKWNHSKTLEGEGIFHKKIIPLKIKIEDDVWIGSGCVILPGVTLARGTVVGANSTVTKNTRPYSVVYGSPAKESRIRN